MEKLSNEKRLIYADALLDEFLKRYTERERNGNLVFAACEIKQDFADMISNFPTVDAVEVVRCEECKKYREPFCIVNDTQSGYLTVVPPEHYCGYGERKDGDGNG